MKDMDDPVATLDFYKPPRQSDPTTFTYNKSNNEGMHSPDALQDFHHKDDAQNNRKEQDFINIKEEGEEQTEKKSTHGLQQ